MADISVNHAHVQLRLSFTMAVKETTDAITPQARVAWVEFANVHLDCWNEDFFKRLGWVVGELLLIEDETLDRRTLANGRVLVLIPKGQKCLEVIKVNTRRQNFTVFVKEDPEPIKYKVILRWLGLDWVNSNGDTSSGLGASEGGRCGGSDQGHGNEEALGRPDIINDKQQIQAIMDKDAMKRKGCIGGTVYKLAMALVEENDDSWSSLSEDNGIREAQDGGQANDIGQNLIDHSNSLESDSDNSKKTGFNSGPDQTDGSYENSVSHVSKTLKTINQGEEALRRHSYGLRTNKPSKYGGNDLHMDK
ncbi:hypothetical protein QYF36_019109 [Acer negundo]|nr:hypothetical protein QYF36_019109 [Acer negundo]